MNQHNTEQQRASDVPTRSSFRPFRGLVVPGIAFESGHVVWLFRYDETPHGRYSCVWIEAPDGELTLYADPAEATAYPRAYHEFDRSVGASIEWLAADRDRLDVAMEGEDGTTLALDAALERTLGTRLMETLGTLVPEPIRRSRAGAAVSSLTLNTLVDAGGLRLRGRTETGARYWGDADALRTVREASATLDGVDLGRRVPGNSTHDFGDVRTAREPYAVFGALHLEYTDVEN